jgi:hypothetical protein
MALVVSDTFYLSFTILFRTTEIAHLKTKIQVFCDVTPCRLVFPDVLKDGSVFNVRCHAAQVE